MQSKIQNSKSKIATPFYDPNLSYQDNYDLGPFGPILEKPSPGESEALDLPRSMWVEVAGLQLRRPLGIPAGPLLNSKFTDAAFRWGFDLLHYKTVRSRFWPSHPTPNVLQVDAPFIAAGDLGRTTLTARRFSPDEPVDVETLSITNSFGMPAQQPDVWQADMERAVRGAGHGQALVASLTGTQDPGADDQAYIDDHARAAAMCMETGAHALEVNLSCPNLGGHGLMCHDPHAARLVCEAISKVVRGKVPLFAKLGSYSPDEQGEATLRQVIEATAPYLQGYSAVNAVPVPVTSAQGEQALPGTGRNVAGVCGAALKPTGLDVVRRLARIRAEQGYDFAIVGVGGLANPDDYLAYLDAGADAVQGATGPMWNHRLVVEIAVALGVRGISSLRRNV